MSDFKNALDSYKRASGRKTVNTGFDSDEVSGERGTAERDKDSVDASGSKAVKRKKTSLPEHLKKADQKTGSGKERKSSAYGSFRDPSVSPGGKKSFKKYSDSEPVAPEKFVFHQLDEKNISGNFFIKETVPNTVRSVEDHNKSDTGKRYTDSGLKRVAKLLALLGKDEAANVLKSFSPADIEKIASELLKIKQIGRDEASELLKIIHKKNTKTEIFSGGVEKAREILVQAYGKEKGEELLKKSLPEKREKPFEFLNDIEPVQIKLALKNESPTVTAIILSHLNPEKSASLIKEYSSGEQKELILKMSHKGKISSEIAEKIENGLKEKIREQGNVITREIDGKNRLAGILRFMDPEEEERILEELKDEDADLSKEIDSKIFSIDIVLDIPDRDFQKVLNDFSEQEIALILKGQEGRIKKKFAKNLSQQRKELIHRESEFIGIVRKSEVNKATTEFTDYIRQFEKEGKIIVNRGGNLFV